MIKRATTLVALFFYIYIKLNFTIMKIKLNTEIERDGKVYKSGDIIDIPELNVPKFIANAWGEPIEEKKAKKKEEKAVKETKQNKDNKETK